MVKTAIRNYAESEMRRHLNYVTATADTLREYLGSIDDWSLPAALEALAHTKRARRKLKGLEIILEDCANAEMLHSNVTTFAGEGFQAIRHEGGHRKEWQHLEVASAVIERTVARRIKQHPDIDPEVVSRLVRDDFAVAFSVAKPEWRSRVLERLGIDADDYSKKVPGAASIELRGPASYDENNPQYSDLEEAEAAVEASWA